jgi:hypothetical protein
VGWSSARPVTTKSIITPLNTPIFVRKRRAVIEKDYFIAQLAINPDYAQNPSQTLNGSMSVIA